ncbi:MAG: hypothetical protein V8S89_05190 [Oscillospiraceae bacterium]
MQIAGFGTALWVGALSGLLYLTSFVLLHWNIRQNGVVLPATFMRLGVLVPAVLAVVLFRETPGLCQLIGFAGALAAIGLLQFDSASGPVKNRWDLYRPAAGRGFTDVMAKVYAYYGQAALKSQYLVYTVFDGAAFVHGADLCQAAAPGQMGGAFWHFDRCAELYLLRFLLLSLDSVPAVVAYPTYSVGAIVLISLAGFAVFHERFTRRRLAALGVILISLVLLNL